MNEILESTFLNAEIRTIAITFVFKAEEERIRARLIQEGIEKKRQEQIAKLTKSKENEGKQVFC